MVSVVPRVIGAQALEGIHRAQRRRARSLRAAKEIVRRTGNFDLPLRRAAMLAEAVQCPDLRQRAHGGFRESRAKLKIHQGGKRRRLAPGKDALRLRGA